MLKANNNKNLQLILTSENYYVDQISGRGPEAHWPAAH